MTYQLLDLFSGIGGFSLGLERSGNFKTVAFCEIEPFCRSVLKKHWPTVKVYEDVKQLTKEHLEADGLSVDAICGGFPCQDISTAGRGAGLSGERSGLWYEFHRLIKEIKPKVVVIENVSALRSRGLDQVLRSLAEIGYDAEWHCIPASAVGAPHRRDRIWVVAYPNAAQCEGNGLSSRIYEKYIGAGINNIETTHVADTAGFGPQGSWMYGGSFSPKKAKNWEAIRTINSCERAKGTWDTEPNVGRVAHGVPNRVDRLRALGNAVVPQIPEMIGRCLK